MGGGSVDKHIATFLKAWFDSQNCRQLILSSKALKMPIADGQAATFQDRQDRIYFMNISAKRHFISEQKVSIPLIANPSFGTTDQRKSGAGKRPLQNKSQIVAALAQLKGITEPVARFSLTRVIFMKASGIKCD
ncbi:MAG: hypothetical protein BWY75_03696 [bacterium ADurb.Bin425]|nr:MAG: hypothetical protein BWY75_03696 [bacterium ADurb.Bin425]